MDNYLELIFANALAHLALMDRDFNFVRVNERYARADSKRPEDLVGKNHFALYPNAENEAIFKRVVESGEAYSVNAKAFEYEYAPERGVSHWDWTLIPIRGAEGAVEYVLLWLVDVTERVKAEQELKASVREKEALIRELYHRTKNNMQVIAALMRLQRAEITDPAMTNLLDDMENRIMAMALVHEKLYQTRDLNSLDLGDYVKSLTDALTVSHCTNLREIRFDLQVSQVTLGVQSVVPTGLVLNELITNSIKHGFRQSTQGTIFLSIRRDATPDREYVLIEYSDDGNPFPEGFQIGGVRSLGLRLVRTITETQLSGALTFLPEKKLFRIRYPIR